MIKVTFYIYENSINYWRGGRVKECRWDAFDQNTLFACMEISQWNTFVQLIYASKVFLKKKMTMS
jgi:hypothetical protein